MKNSEFHETDGEEITREVLGLSENVVPLNLIVNHNFLLTLW